MPPAPVGSRTIVSTFGGATTVTINVTATGFTAFGRTWTYDSGTDSYVDSKGEMHIRFLTSPSQVFVATWGTDNFGGTWS